MYFIKQFLQTLFIISIFFYYSFIYGGSLESQKKISSSLLSSFSLEELTKINVTTATLTNESLKTTPSTMFVFTAKEIEAKHYTSILDLLETIPGIQISRNSSPTSVNGVVIRGIWGINKFLIFLNGHRISSPTNESLSILENYPVHMADQVEFLVGPASALYGADAISGVINIITNNFDENMFKASIISGEFGLYNINFASRYNFDNGLQLMLSGQFFKDNQPGLSNYYLEEFKEISSLETGIFNTLHGPMSPDEIPIPNYSLPLKADALIISFKLKNFILEVFNNYSSISTSTAYKPNNAIYNSSAFMATDMTTISLKHNINLGENFSNYFNVSYNEQEMDPHSNFRNVFTGMNPGYKYSFGSEFHIEDRIYIEFNTIKITCGLSYEEMTSVPRTAETQNPVNNNSHSDISGIFLGTNIPAKFYHLRYNNKGIFVQGQYNYQDTLYVTAGVRYDNNSKYSSSFNPRLGIVWNLTHKSTIKLMYGSSFQAPSPLWSHSYFGSFITKDNGETYFSKFMHLPNPILEPEKSNTYEVNFSHTFNKNLILSTGLFLNKLDNTIVTAIDSPDSPDSLYHGEFLGWPVKNIRIFVNQGHEKIYGGFVQFLYQNKFQTGIDLKTNFNLSFVEGKVFETSLNKEIEIANGIAPISMKFETTINYKVIETITTIKYINESRVPAYFQDINEITGRKTLDGFWIIDLIGNYRLPSKGITFFVKINNLTDKRYKTSNRGAFKGVELDGIPQNPRRFFLGLSYVY